MSNRDQGDRAERIVADRLDLDRSDTAPWYDAVSDSGTKYEVKSTHVGHRFHLWENQHKSLTASDRRGTAWYVFVLFDANDSVAAIQLRRPKTVGQHVRHRGGWNQAGYREDLGRKHKLPAELVVSP
jgi:hypothetical protein